MTMSVASFNCPHCVDLFVFDWQRIRSLTLHSRARVRCPGCQNVVEVVMYGYSVIKTPPHLLLRESLSG